MICTYFYRQGDLPREDWRRDLLFTKERLTTIHVRGYHIWAVPYVGLMKRNKLARRAMWWVTRHRANEIAYQMGERDRPDYRGKLMRLILEPFCFVIGLGGIIASYQEDWTRLYRRET